MPLVSEIERKGRISPDDCRAFHIDFNSIPGLELQTRLKGFAATDPDARLALDLLLKWDGWLGADSIGGTVYQVVLSRLAQNLIAPAIGPELTNKFMGGSGPHPLLTPVTEFIGHSTVTILKMLDDPESVWVKSGAANKK